MIDRPTLGTTEHQLVAVLHARDEIFGCLVWAGLTVNHQDLRVIGTAGNRSHVLDFELGFALAHSNRVTYCEGHYRVAICRPGHKVVHCQGSTTTTLVHHNHILFKRPATAQHHHSRVNISTPTGSSMCDDFNGRLVVGFDGDTCQRHQSKAGGHDG